MMIKNYDTHLCGQHVGFFFGYRSPSEYSVAKIILLSAGDSYFVISIGQVCDYM